MLRSNGAYYVNPSFDQVADSTAKDFLYISDTYVIEIRPTSSNDFPMAFELGGRIEAAGRKHNKSTTDMHKYVNGGLCVASSMELEKSFPNGVNLEAYIEDFLIPYLFTQSHFANTGDWVWGDLSHGYIGLLEWLGNLEPWLEDDVELTYKWMTRHVDRREAVNALKTRHRSHKKCICKSGKKMRECHPNVKRALAAIRIAINNKTLDTSKYPIANELSK